MNYTIKAAARATGISESRLRTWERRYGIPQPDRTVSGRRLYSEEDLSLIRRVSSLLDAGMSAAQAAEAARSGIQTPEQPSRTPHELVAILAEATANYDEPLFVTSLRRAIAELDWPRALETVVFPALNRVGIFWETALIPAAGEHLATELVRRELLAAISALPAAPATAGRVMLACPEDERHDIGLAALALLLRRKGLAVTYLGADLPTHDLIEAIDVSNPDAVCLSATSRIGLASLVRASRRLASACNARVYVGGPAIATDGSEAAGIRLPGNLEEAAEAIAGTLPS